MEEKQNNKWNAIDKLNVPGARDDNTELMKILTNASMDVDVAQEVISQLREATSEKHNIVFIFTEGDYVVTAIHVPKNSINGENGPVLLRGATDKSIIAAFSKEYIQSEISSVDSIEDEAGLIGIADAAWLGKLEKMALAVKIEMDTNPPEKWEDLLNGGN